MENDFVNNYFGKSLPKVDVTSRLKVAAKLLRDGLGSKSESFAKAIYLTIDDLRTLLPYSLSNFAAAR